MQGLVVPLRFGKGHSAGALLQLVIPDVQADSALPQHSGAASQEAMATKEVSCEHVCYWKLLVIPVTPVGVQDAGHQHWDTHVVLHMWCVCVGGVHLHMCECGDQRPMSGVFLNSFLPYFLRQGFSMNLELTHLTSTKDILFPPPPPLGL